MVQCKYKNFGEPSNIYVVSSNNKFGKLLVVKANSLAKAVNDVHMQVGK